MARSVLYIGDANPPLVTRFTYADGTPVNGTGHAAPLFSLRYAYGSANIFTGTAAWSAGTTSTSSQATGDASYTFALTDLGTALAPGIATGQWTDIDGAGRKMHLDAGEFELRKGL